MLTDNPAQRPRKAIVVNNMSLDTVNGRESRRCL
jgi:hypothetical protein